MNNFESKSSKFLYDRDALPPLVSAITGSAVSAQRKEMLYQEIQDGTLRESKFSKKDGGLTPASYVSAHIGQGTVKSAQVASSNTSTAHKGSFGNSLEQSPEIYSPLWLNSNQNMPRDRATINAWCRSFYVLNPFVHNAINLHSTYPISKLSIKCKDKEAEDFYNSMIEELDLINVCVQMGQEYWLLGEVFPYLEFDASQGKWSRIMLQNPDYMIVNRTPVSSEPQISMRPDSNLQKIVFSNKPGDVEQRKKLNPYIIDAVKRGNNIPLDNFNVHHLARKVSPYETRGTGLPVCIFRQLALFDMLRESKFAQASNMINPLTLIKIGNDKYKPEPQDLEAWRDTFAAAHANKDFKVFTHDGVTIERVGYASGIYDISGDITQLIKEIYVGLQVPQVLMDGGEYGTYANGSVALDVLRQRYMQFRNMMAHWLKTKVFAPIAYIRGMYDKDSGKNKLILPEIEWNHMSLFDVDTYVSSLKELSTAGEDGQKRASLHTLYKSLGLEYEDEIRKIKKELIQSTILKKEKENLDKMSLTELRSITDETEIIEKLDENGDTADGSGGEPGADGGLGELPGVGGNMTGEPAGDAIAPPPPPPTP